MGHRLLPTILLRICLALVVLAMPAAVAIGMEDGPTPAVQLFRQKALARTVLFTGGVIAALAACGLYAISRPWRPWD